MKTSGTAIVAVAAMLTGGCQMFGADDEPAIDEEEAARVHTMLDENQDLTNEVVDGQYRLILDCVEERGYTVHDLHEGVMWNFQKYQLPEQDRRYMPFWADRDIASEWGFGIWTSTFEMYGSEEHREFAALSGEVETFVSVDNSAFEALSEEERYDWYVAYYGEERARVDQGWLVGETGEGGPGGLIGSVKPGGCMGEVTEAFGLEPEFVPLPEFGEEAGNWSTYPVPPGSSVLSNGELDEELREERQLDEEYLRCLEDAGWGEWGFTDAGRLNIATFLETAYGEGGTDRPEFLSVGVPEPPADVPVDADERRDWEVGFALDLHDCADETGFEKDAERAWHVVYGSHFLELEAEIYAWQDQMRDIIETAQELLAA